MSDSAEFVRQGYRGVPISYKLTGDKDEAKRLIGYANQLFLCMETAMRSQGLFQLKQSFSPAPGLVITCAKIGRENKISIDVSEEYGGQVKKKVKSCFCECGAAVGWINQSPGSTVTVDQNGKVTQEDDLNWIPQSNTKYEVGACQEVDIDEFEPVLLKNKQMVPTDFYRHFRSLNQTLDTLLIIQDKDITITKPDGTTDQKHIPAEEATPCVWDVFRVTSIEPIDIDVEETETTT